MSNGLYSLSMIDHESEHTILSFAVPQLTAVTVLTIGAELAAFRAAVAGISGGTFVKERFTQIDDTMPGVAPINLYQREAKYLVRYHDTVTGQKFRVEVPCANLSLLPAGVEFLDLTAGPGLAFKTAFQLFAVSPLYGLNGNTVLVDSIQYVGRRS